VNDKYFNGMKKMHYYMICDVCLDKREVSARQGLIVKPNNDDSKLYIVEDNLNDKWEITSCPFCRDAQIN
jgi:hypothetical protein